MLVVPRGVGVATYDLAVQIQEQAGRFGLESEFPHSPPRVRVRRNSDFLYFYLRGGQIESTVPCWVPTCGATRKEWEEAGIHPIDWAISVLARFALDQFPQRGDEREPVRVAPVEVSERHSVAGDIAQALSERVEREMIRYFNRL